MKDVEIIGMIRTYIEKTLVGMGALKGAPCQVQGTVDEGDGTQTLTLKWEDTAGVTHTTDITLPAALFEVLNPTNGQTLKYNSVSGKFENSNVSFSADLDDLDDVVINSVQDGQVLTYDAANGRWVNANGSTVAALSELTDVTITTAQNGQFLTYDAVNSKWINTTLAIAAGDVNYNNSDSGLEATKVQGAIDELASKKVDKETGKGLSANDFTNTLKTKLDGIEDGAEINEIDTVKVNGTALTPDADKAVNIEEKISKLSDVDLTGLADEMILIYDATNNKWYAGANTGANYTAGEGIEIDQNNVISSKMVLFTGTEAQWNALPLSDKIKFTHYATNDDQTGQIDPVPTQNSNNLMTSGGIYTALQDKANTSDLGTAATKDSTNAVTQSSTDLVESGAVYTAIDNAVKALDVTDSAVAGSYVTAVSETDGAISVTREAADATPTASSNKMVKSGGVYNSEQDIYKINGFLGAKNLVRYPYFYGISGHTETLNNVDFAINDDLSITIDGTSTNSGETYYAIKKNIYINDLKSKNLILSSGGVSGTDVWLGVYEYDQEGTSTVTHTYTTKDTDTVAFTLDDTTIKINVFIRVKALATIDNVTIYPMLRYAEDTDNTYQPYAKTNQELTEDSVDWDNYSELGAVNFFDNTAPDKSQNGAVYTLNADKSETISAATYPTTVSANASTYCTVTLPKGTYRLSGCPSGGSDSTYRLSLTGIATNAIFDYGDGVVFTVSEKKTGTLYIDARANWVITEPVTFYPMITPVSYKGSYVPYAMTNRGITELMTIPKPFVPTGTAVDSFTTDRCRYAKIGQFVLVQFHLKLKSTAASGTDAAIIDASDIGLTSWVYTQFSIGYGGNSSTVRLVANANTNKLQLEGNVGTFPAGEQVYGQMLIYGT